MKILVLRLAPWGMAWSLRYSKNKKTFSFIHWDMVSFLSFQNSTTYSKTKTYYCKPNINWMLYSNSKSNTCIESLFMHTPTPTPINWTVAWSSVIIFQMKRKSIWLMKCNPCLQLSKRTWRECVMNNKISTKRMYS